MSNSIFVKLTLLSAALLISFSAAAKNFVELGQDAVAVSNLGEGKILKVEPLCPKNHTCVVDGTVVTIQFTLKGCMDSLGNVAYLAVENGGQLDIAVSATNIHDERSKSVMCLVPKTESVKLQLINKFGNVEVDFLK